MQAPASQPSAPPHFSCDVENADGVVVVTGEGELDLATAATLCGAVEATFRDRGARVLVDLATLEFCDSTGLRALVGVVHEARVHRVRLRIVEPAGDAAARAMELAGAREFLPLVPSREEGVAALA
ncbi:MAG TPA: STAS domain-containing protein [Solirubrobacter sp.]|nr:STAS domain-containing protein [Solirubrobacter sp.]